MTTAEKQIEAIRKLADIIEDVASEAGPMGAPSGLVYSAVNGLGVSLEVYQAILASMERHGRITVKVNCIHATKRAEAVR